ncbi:MAG TPA: hypothetical protein VGA42_07035 [Gemmatimonadales bacterium]
MTTQSQRATIGSRAWTKVLAAALILGSAGVVAATVVNRKDAVDVTIPAGTAIVGALDRTLSTEDTEVGDRVSIRTTEPLQVDQWTLPAGIVLRGEVTESREAGRVRTRAKLAIRFDELELDGREYTVSSQPFVVRGRSEGKSSLKKVGIGAVAGAVVGAVAGGGSGAAKGAAAGAVIGTGVAVATDGKDLVLPSGQRLSVRLNQPVTVRYYWPE